MSKIINNNSWEIKYYDFKSDSLVSSEDVFANKVSIAHQDIDGALENGLFTLRRPGQYRAICGLATLPPKTSWSLCKNTYTFNKDLRKKIVPFEKSWDEIDVLVKKYLNLISDKKVAIELSGGLDTSLVIEYFLGKKIDISLIGFISDRWEFRTERAIQEYYLNRVENYELLSYEECSAFSNLLKCPPHPVPQQESLFYDRHKLMAGKVSSLKCEYLFSGEAGDQIFGFPADEIKVNQFLPNGYGYWSLAEQWNAQYIYKKHHVNYISALGVGLIPSYLLSKRCGSKADHMKLWVRNELSNMLPTMLSKYAYKGFHDGWVSDGLKFAYNDIEIMSELSYRLTRHKALDPSRFLNEIKVYSSLSEKEKSTFLTKLSLVNWIHSLAVSGHLS